MNEHEVLQIIFPPGTKFANVAHVQFSLDFDIKQIKRQLSLQCLNEKRGLVLQIQLSKNDMECIKAREFYRPSALARNVV